MKEGNVLKSIKRATKGWGGEQDKPKDLVKRNRDYDDKTVLSLRKGISDTPKSSPAHLQKRVLDREIKKRWFGDEPKEGINLSKGFIKEMKKVNEETPQQLRALSKSGDTARKSFADKAKAKREEEAKRKRNMGEAETGSFKAAYSDTNKLRTKLSNIEKRMDSFKFQDKPIPAALKSEYDKTFAAVNKSHSTEQGLK